MCRASTGSGRSRCSSSLSRRRGDSPWRGLLPPYLLGACAGHVDPSREPGSWCLPAPPPPAGGTCRRMWGEGFEVPYAEDIASARSSELFANWESRAPRSSNTPECLERGLSPRGVTPATVCMERGLPPRDVAPKLELDETVELLTRVLGASEQDPDLSALSAALKIKLGLSDLRKPSSTIT